MGHEKDIFYRFFFIFVSQSIADEMTINSLLKEGYKIKDDRFISRGANRSDQKVVTLIKGKNYVVCTINVSSISGPRFQKCIKP